MELKIKHRAQSYSIYEPFKKEVLYTGYWERKKFFSLEMVGELFDASDKSRYHISVKPRLFKRYQYQVRNTKGETYISSPDLPGKTSYTFKDEKDVYRIRFHGGNRFSIVNQNNVQIASISESSFELFGRSSTKIIAEKDINIELLFLCVLCINFGDTDKGSTDLGEIWYVEPFNRWWRPRNP